MSLTNSEPIHILSLGAGVQSSTLALMAACGEVTPMPLAAIFADTQAEPDSVYRWLDWLEKQLPFPVHRVTAGSLEADVLKPRITKDGRRYCRTPPLLFLSPMGDKFSTPPDRLHAAKSDMALSSSAGSNQRTRMEPIID
jgi:hypothetical protein